MHNRLGKHISHLHVGDALPPMPWAVRTEMMAIDVWSTPLYNELIEFMRKHCCHNDWCMYATEGKMQFNFMDERDAIIFKLNWC